MLLPDDVIRAPQGALSQMVDAHRANRGHMVATMDVPRAKTSSYGILDVASEKGRLTHARGLVEKPQPDRAPSTQAIVGRYILEPSIFARLADLGPGAGGELQLTDAINADSERYGCFRTTVSRENGSIVVHSGIRSGHSRICAGPVRIAR